MKLVEGPVESVTCLHETKNFEFSLGYLHTILTGAFFFLKWTFISKGKCSQTQISKVLLSIKRENVKELS